MRHVEHVEESSPVTLHDQNLQSVALALFDGTTAVHRLGQRTRGLLQYAAAYYDAARAVDAAQPGRIARDIVLNAQIDDLKPEQQCIIASALAFQREKLRRSRETAFLRLDKADQETALRLAAILGCADALCGADALLLGKASGTELWLRDDTIAAHIAARAERWRKHIGPLTVNVATSDMPAFIEPPVNKPPVVLITLDGLATNIDRLRGDEPITEGARRMLRRLFERMLAREEAVRQDEDPEDVHQMRVAIRRLRASLQIVEPLYDPALLRMFRNRLRGVATALGIVRDRDVFLIDLAAHRDALPEEQRAALEPLLERVEHERAEARLELGDKLDSRRYEKFKHAFATFLTTPGMGVATTPETGLPLRVRDRAGAMIWRRYEDWRSFEATLPHADDATLHQARIAGKRLRYTIEFFADALGPKSDEVLDALAALQETLGALQDAVVAREYIHTLDLDDDPSAHAYVASRSATREQHLAALPRVWDKVGNATYRRKLFELIIRM